MDHLPKNASRAAEAPFLRNPQGWTFFLETSEIVPGRWRSGVRIHALDATLVVRLRCKDDRSTEAQAQQDAEDCAAANFRKLEARRRHEESARDAADLSCDERRKAEMLLMAFLWLDQEARAPAARAMGADPSCETTGAGAGDCARLRQQSCGLREKSHALIDELRMPRDRGQSRRAGAGEAAEFAESEKTGAPDRRKPAPGIRSDGPFG